MRIATSTAGRFAASTALVVATLAGPATAAAATFVVNDASDQPDAALNGSCDADAGTGGEQCTLRAAIQEANNGSGPDAIHFAIGASAPVTIAPATKLPAITTPVTIDGATQPSLFAERPGVVLDATGETGGDGPQFLSGSGGSSLTGLSITHSPGYGLRVAAPLTVFATWIGAGVTGDAAAANAAGGILVTAGGAQSSLGLPDELPNLISGNGGPGMEVVAGPVSIQNNYIGTTVSGRLPLANEGPGIQISDNATGDVVGGATAASANVIGGNSGGGIVVDGSTDVQIVGNLVGAGATGAYAVGNAGAGISLTDAPGAQIGAIAATAARNLISGNSGAGVVIGTGSTDAAVNGNYIGLHGDGSAIGAGGVESFGNSGDGLDIQASGAAVGTSVRNVISGQLGAGVRVAAAGAVVRNNYIGTDASGQLPAGNGTQGIVVEGGTGTEITGNTVSASADSQLRLDGSTGAIVQGNTFGYGGPLLPGINVGGTAPAIALVNSTSGTVLGGTGAGQPNFIVGQQGSGPGIA